MFAGCRCPREPDRELKAAEVAGRKVLACRRCGGAFVDAELGLRLLAALRADVPEVDDDAQQLPCPVCRAGMRTAEPKEVPIKVAACVRHGVWFDGGDLLLVARAAAKVLGKPVPKAAQRDPAPGAQSTGWTSFHKAHPMPPKRPPTARDDLLEGVVDTSLAAAAVTVDTVDFATDVITLPIEVTVAVVGGMVDLFDW